MTSNLPTVSFIGFGEAGQAFASGMLGGASGLQVTAYDIKTEGPEAAVKQADYARIGVTGVGASGTADVIFSLVTAEEAETAASTAAQTALNGALFFDCNSCAPETKRRSAQRIEAAGGRYVDVAVMTPVHPRLHRSPCLIAGPHAEAAAAAMTALGMDVTIAGGDVGLASTRKMIRSIMIKGLEALTLECFLAAHKAGVAPETLASLDASFPDFNWSKRGAYMVERAMTHGTRRAAEMREVAQTLRDLGLDPAMVTATVQRQEEMGTLGLDAKAIGADDLSALSHAILDALTPSQRED